MADLETSEEPPHWEAFLGRLATLTDPHSIRGAQVEYLETLFPTSRVEYTPRDLAPLAGAEPRRLASTLAYRLEGLPFRSDSALLDDMILISGPPEVLHERHLVWLARVREAVRANLVRTETVPPDDDEHPVTRLGREPLLHQCVRALSGESKIVFHGLFLSIDGFPNRWPEASSPAGDEFLRELAALLRDTHPPRSARFHLSRAFFAVLCLGPTRREYRKMVWDLRNLILRRGFLPNSHVGLSMSVIFWPTDACFPGPFCDLLLVSLNKARRKGGNSVIFTEDWYRNPFGR